VPPAPAPVAPRAVRCFRPPDARPGRRPDEVISDEELEEALDDEAAEPLSIGGPAHGTVRTPECRTGEPGGRPDTLRERFRPPPAATRAAAATATRTMVTESTGAAAAASGHRDRELADAIVSMDPKISEEDLAKRLNISVARLRQVRKEADARRAAGVSRG
jgi:hypothetical protein